MARVWKICQLLFVTTIFSGCVSSLLAQTQVLENRFSVNFNNISYESVIDSLRVKVKAGFSYNPDFFPKDKKCSYHGVNQKLGVILDSLFIPVKFTYKVVDNNIVIVPLGNNQTTRKEPYTIDEIDTMKVVKLSGKVIDRKDRKPIEFTSIYIHNRNIATMSNANGNFTFKLPKDCTEDSVFFSCMGYQPVRRKIGDLLPDNNIILMDVISIQLKAVKVKPINPKEIIRKTIENIPDNYSRIPLNLISFYREVIQQNGEYVGLSEAVLNIYKAPYNGFANDQVSIFKGRKTRFPKQMDTVLFKFQGGISTSLMLDIAKNPSNFLTDEYLGFYDFTVDEAVMIGDRLTYVIGFDQNDNCPYSLYKGKLYIDMDTYSLVRAEFMISPKGLENSADVLVRKSSRRLKVKPTFSLYIVNYTLQNHTWYLNYIKEEVEFRVRRKYSLYRTSFRSKAEMLITQTDSVDVKRMKQSKLVHSNDIFFEKIGNYDSEYWGGFNIIRPDEPLEEALHKIKVKFDKSNR